MSPVTQTYQNAPEVSHGVIVISLFYIHLSYTFFNLRFAFHIMLGRGIRLAILMMLAILGILVAIPSGLTSLIITGVAVIGIAAVLIGSVLR